MTSPLPVTELKAYVPAKDRDVSRRFDVDLGSHLEWGGPGDSLACFGIGNTRFLLQAVGKTFRPDYFAMHLLVPDVLVWWEHISEQKLAENYGVTVEPPQDRSWGLRDLVVIDPSGVVWRIGQPMPIPPADQTTRWRHHGWAARLRLIDRTTP